VTARKGFTLIEVTIALVIGAVVVLLAYSTLHAGMDVEDRVSAARDADESTTAMRALLTDAVRHAVTGDARDMRGMHMETDAHGQPARLEFMSRGVDAPLGGTAAWQIVLSSDTAGVTLNATPLDSSRTPLRLSARGARAFAVRFLPIDDDAWRTQWDDPARLPFALEVRFLDASGKDVMEALLARTSPVGGL
jgi:prepilin-type N-terminal cleavage/methylation domain-containing protein